MNMTAFKKTLLASSGPALAVTITFARPAT